jgi:3'-5' exoribonuclease
LYLETTTNVSPGGWSHHENPLDPALYVPDEPEHKDPGELAESP